MIDNSSIETLKLRLDIVDVVGHFLELKRSGASFKAICPFHNDTTPSMHVSPQKQIYHCFACGAGGDSIKFVMEYEKLNYPEAIERLAAMYNFSLSYTKDDGKIAQQKRVLELLNSEFKRLLSQNEEAKEYLKQRGIFNSSVEKFEIGYAPSSGQSLSFLQNSGVSIAEAKEVGVADTGNDGRAYARFIERITFPIYAQNGKLVGFGGRTISGHPAKYVNSPQTKLFNKSRLLYGFDKAKEAIHAKKTIIVTEGYLDVVMLHQAGFTNAVATLGTALTNEHIPLLTRSEARVIVSYDGDTAGINAALKASKLLSAHSVDGGVVIFQGGLDPADMVVQGKVKELESLFNSNKPFVQFCLEQIVKSFDISEPLQKQSALQEASEYLKTLPNVVASEYQGVLASLLHIQEDMVKVNRVQKKKRTSNEPRRFEDFQELSIIKTLLETPHLIDTVLDRVDKSMFRTHQEEFSLLLQNRYDDARLRRILLWDDVKTLNEEELSQTLFSTMIFYYQNLLKSIKSDKTMDFTTKSFNIRKVQEKIFKLKKGEMVPYEDFGTI